MLMGAERVKCRNGMSTRARDPYAKKDTHLAKEHTRALGYHWDIIAQAIPLGVACA